MNEIEAISLLRKGDFYGLAWLVETFQLKAIRTAFLVTNDRPLAEDVVQSKFVQLTRTIRQFDPARPFEPWFLRGVINAALTAIARQKREVLVSDLGDFEDWMGNIVDSPSFEFTDMNSYLAGEVWSRVAKLSPSERAVIVMRYYLEMNEQEMSATANVARGTIKWRLNQAREKLRGWLGSDPRKEKEA